MDATDAVKTQKILTEEFRGAPVGTGIWQSNASYRAYEGYWLEIGLIMWPPHNFRMSAPAPLEKIARSQKQTFSIASTQSGRTPRQPL
jgi:hypothetical protein